MPLTIMASAISSALFGSLPKKTKAVVQRSPDLHSECGLDLVEVKRAGGTVHPRSADVSCDLDNLAVAVKVYRRL